MIEFLLIVLGAFLAWQVWGIVCVDRTYAQRRQLIEAMRDLGGDDFERLAHMFVAVRFRQHERELMWLRDPLKLYDPALSSLVQGSFK